PHVQPVPPVQPGQGLGDVLLRGEVEVEGALGDATTPKNGVQRGGVVADSVELLGGSDQNGATGQLRPALLRHVMAPDFWQATATASSGAAHQRMINFATGSYPARAAPPTRSSDATAATWAGAPQKRPSGRF